MNGISDKFIADFTHLANEQLDHIAINNLEDFDKISVALRILLEKNEVIENGDDDLKNRIKDIKDIMDCPEMYAQQKKDCDVIREIFKTRIAARIEEYEAKSPEERQQYIDHLNKEKNEVKTNQEIMHNAQPPQIGSEAHTISEQQWHAEMQANLNPGNLQNLIQLITASQRMRGVIQQTVVIADLNREVDNAIIRFQVQAFLAIRPRDEADIVLNTNREINFPNIPNIVSAQNIGVEVQVEREVEVEQEIPVEQEVEQVTLRSLFGPIRGFTGTVNREREVQVEREVEVEQEIDFEEQLRSQQLRREHGS